MRTPAIASVNLWETRTGRKLAELPHAGFENFRFSPNGKILVSAGPGSMKIWPVSQWISGPAH